MRWDSLKVGSSGARVLWVRRLQAPPPDAVLHSLDVTSRVVQPDMDGKKLRCMTE